MVYIFLHYGGTRMYQESPQTRHTKKNCIPGFPILLALITSCVLVIFIDTNTYKITERRNFKTF